MIHTDIKELIDTLWNVNLILRQRVLQQQQRINRYIMECKCSKQTQLRVATSELIDTLWNVNTAPPISAVIVHVELIDTLWNVNHKKPQRDFHVYEN